MAALEAAIWLHRMTTAPLVPLLAAIQAVSDWLNAGSIASAIVGGVAASIHGRPRVTKDVDLVALIDIEDCEALLRSAGSHGIEARDTDTIEFARVTRVLLLRHAPSGVEIDLSLGALPFERELVECSTSITVSDVEIRLARPEDLVIMKALALRPRDVADIEAILEANPDMDLDRVRTKVAEFSAILEEADLVAELDRIIDKTRRRI